MQEGGIAAQGGALPSLMQGDPMYWNVAEEGSSTPESTRELVSLQ